MFVHSHRRPRPARATPRGRYWVRRPGLLVALALAVLPLQGCKTPSPTTLSGADPADPRAHAPPVHYRSTVGAYQRQRPVEPRGWDAQNQGVAPAPRSDR